MATPNSSTDNFDALVSSTLKKWGTQLRDQISTSNALFYLLKKSGMWKIVDEIGRQATVPLMYGLGKVDTYAGYDPINMTPTDGITTALFDWRSFASAVMISGEEMAMNRGEARLFSLLDAKTMQIKIAMEEFCSKMWQQGNLSNGGHIYSNYASPENTSTYIDPIAKLIDIDPTQSRTVGGIDQSVAANSWWRNVGIASAATSFALLFSEMDRLVQDTSKGPGGEPDLYVTDQEFERLYKKGLRVFHQNPSFEKADLPFRNVAFNGHPMTWDEFAADIYSDTLARTYSTLYAINTKFMEIQVDAQSNFSVGEYMKVPGQDAKAADILTRLAALVSNRRKHGVLGKISQSIAS